VGCSRIRESASALLRASWLPGCSVRAWGRHHRRQSGLRLGSRAAHRGSASPPSPQRIARHRGAREVVDVGRCASGFASVAEAFEQRRPQRSHRGCGRGGGRGASQRRETGTWRTTLPGSTAGNGGWPRRPAEGRSVVEGTSGRGSCRPSRVGRGSDSSGAHGYALGVVRASRRKCQSHGRHLVSRGEQPPRPGSEPDEAGCAT